MWFLVRFVEIKVENKLTWFLICFSKKKNIKYGLTCFLCNFALEKIKFRKRFESEILGKGLQYF